MQDLENKVDIAIKKLNNFIDDIHEDAKKAEKLKLSKTTKTTKTTKTSDKTVKDYLYYANIKNPETNEPYIIPMLSLTDPAYTNKYVEYMKTLEQQPEMFNKILNWD